MSDQIDSAIKLFGRTISLTTKASDHDHHSPPTHVSLDHNPTLSHEGTLVNVSGKQDKVKEISQNDGSNSNGVLEDSKDPTTTSSGVSEDPKTSSGDNRETSSHKSFKRGEQSETSSSQEKPLKKPDKILPCPRCSSMDTKFCYYNNYNVNQPRHFCKNCQRYWTAGGSMRNVPVGAGRRKSKTSSTTSSNHHQDMAVSEALLAAQASSANGLLYGGRILTFGSDQSPPCESVQQKPEQKKAINNPTSDHHKESHHSCSSFPQACFPAAAAPWPFHPWNSAAAAAAVPLPSPPHAFCPPSFPVSFYHPPPPYWGYNLVPPPCHPLISLGKHSRDENSSWRESKEQYSERQVLVPKTLRIDDPGEAARSSIWATLGIKGENKRTSITTGGVFNRFQSKSDERSPPSSALQANPAALSRSVKFHEST